MSTWKSFLYYVNLIILPLGIVFNLITILIFNRKKFSKNTMGFYYSIVALIDILSLIMLFLFFFGISIDSDFVSISNISCKMINYWTRVFNQLSSWINVLITVDRLICIKYSNNRFVFLKNKFILSLILLCNFILLCILNIPNLFYNLAPQSSQNTTATEQTVFKCVAPASLATIRDICANISKLFLPFILMIISNIWLIRILVYSKKKVKLESRMKKESQFAFSLIAINIFFMLSLTPITVATILINIFQNQPTSRIFYAMTLTIFITTYISAFYYAMAFFVHLKFNKLFFREVCLILIYWRIIIIPINKNRISSLNTMENNNSKQN